MKNIDRKSYVCNNINVYECYFPILQGGVCSFISSFMMCKPILQTGTQSAK